MAESWPSVRPRLSAQLIGLGRTPRNMMGMNAPGSDNRQLALNIMHWLSGLLEPELSAQIAGPDPIVSFRQSTSLAGDDNP